MKNEDNGQKTEEIKLMPLSDYDAKFMLLLVPHYFGDTGDMYGMRVLRAIEAAHGINGDQS